MTQIDSVSMWISELKAGDSHAAQKLWERYVDQLVRLARAKLGGTSRRVADEDDLANSIFNGAFLGIQSGRFPQMNDRDDLWQVLVVLTERKSVDYRRRTLAEKRGGGTVRGDSIFGDTDAEPSPAGGFHQVIGDAPTPEFAAQASEEFQRLLARLNDETLRRIALAKMEGYSNEEIARMLSMSLSSVERKLRIIRRIWESESDN